METLYKLSVMLNLSDNMSVEISGASRAVNELEKNLASLNKTLINTAKSGLVMVVAGKEIMKFALSPVEALFETRKALGELASVGITDLEALENAGKQFSETWAGTTKAEFISSAYDIKSGISSLSDEAVARYTEIAGITAKGTKSSIDEMTSLFATGYGIYKDYYSDLSDMEFAEMFSAGIASAVQQFKTDGSQMAQSMQTLGASATSANVPLEEQLSILGMLQSTMSGSEAGTKYKAFLQSANKAGEDLGLSFTDANNQLISMPEILEQLQSKFGDTIDAGEKMQLQSAFGSAEAVALIDLLYNKTEDLQGNIVNMYGSLGEGVDVATEMANVINSSEGDQYQILQQRLHNIIETIGNGMLPTVNEALQKFNNFLTVVSDWVSENEELAGTIMLVVAGFGALITTLGLLKIAIGAVGLLGTTSVTAVLKLKGVVLGIPSVLDTIALKGMYAKDTLVTGFGKVQSASRTALGGIKTFGMGVYNAGKQAVVTGIQFTKDLGKSIITTGKQMVMTSVGAVKSFSLSIFNMGKQAVTTAITSMPALISSVWAFTSALLANPITWVVIGIVALIGALYLLWKNWDTVVAWLNSAWNTAVTSVINTFNWIKEKINEVPESVLNLIMIFFPFLGIPLLIIQNWDVLKEFFGGLWTSISTGFTNFFTGWLPNLLESGKKIMTTLADGITMAAATPVNAVKASFGNVRQLLPFSDAKEGPLSELTLSGSKILTTLAEGVETASPTVYNAVKGGLQKVQNIIPFASIIQNPLTKISSDIDEVENKSSISESKKEVKTINLKEIIASKTEKTIEDQDRQENKTGGITIGNMTVNFDIKDLEDIKFIKLLIAELKDLQNQTDGNNDDKEVVTA